MTKHTVDRRTFITQASAAGVAGVVLTNTTAQGERLAQATPETFTPYCGETFRLEDEDGVVIRAKLQAVEVRTRQPEIARQPFSLLFQAPQGKEIEKEHFLVRHPKLGTMPMFIVRIDHRPHNNQLEAIFS